MGRNTLPELGAIEEMGCQFCCRKQQHTFELYRNKITRRREGFGTLYTCSWKCGKCGRFKTVPVWEKTRHERMPGF